MLYVILHKTAGKILEYALIDRDLYIMYNNIDGKNYIFFTLNFTIKDKKEAKR